MKNISLITLNKPGLESAEKTAEDLLKINPDFNIRIFTNGEKGNFTKIDDIINEVWASSDVIIWFTATGIVVRKIAGLVNSKTSDPAVLVMNIDRTQIIPLLSGHLGGANEISQQLAFVNKNLTVFTTTATDSLDILAFDNYAKQEGYKIINIDKLAKISNSLINKQPINVITYPSIRSELEKQGLNSNSAKFYDCENIDAENMPTVVISPFSNPNIPENLDFVFKIMIKPISIGIGLNRNTPFEELEVDFYDFLDKNNLILDDVSIMASFEAKKG